jgi:hypothetical protein
VSKEVLDGARADSVEIPYIDVLLMRDKGIIDDSLPEPLKTSGKKKAFK